MSCPGSVLVGDVSLDREKWLPGGANRATGGASNAFARSLTDGLLDPAPE